MRLVVLLFLATVFHSLLLSGALDDDEGEDSQQYAVTFFQFQPKDIPMLGGHRKNPFKRDIKRSTVEGPLQNKTTADVSNATAPLTSNDTSVSSANETTPLNATTSLQNSSSTTDIKENSTASTPATASSDVNIMNALINLAQQKTNKTSNSSEAPPASNATASATPAVSNTTSVANKTKAADSTTKRSHIMSSAKRDKVLNPNPKPSEQEAALNVKPPKQLENKEHDNVIHSENTTKVDVSEDKTETTTQSVEMIKQPNPPENPSPDNSTATVQNATTAPAATPETPSAEDEKAKKIAKDKQTKEEIVKAAKEITPVLNTVGSPSNEVKDIMTETAPKTGSARNNVHHDKPVDEKTLTHRKKLAEFVPLYHKTTPKDHRLSFQVGSMKHPKHNIHPKCHACPLNSTYKECVRKSTLRECNEGLNNICFTKSTKKDGIITYEMGCSDHNNCVHAKAFPCKDGKDHCFTCCQFDRCNSSPHHGDYELDELNLSELTDAATTASLTDETTGLDTKSGARTITSSMMAVVSTVVVLLFLQL